MKKTEYSYVGIAFIILVFGMIFIPKIVDRISEGDIERTVQIECSSKIGVTWTKYIFNVGVIF